MFVAGAALAGAGCSGPDAVTPPPTKRGAPGPPGNVTAGKTVFLGVSGCEGCHALADAGSTSSVASDLDEKAPSEARVRTFVIKGKGAMPAYGEQLSEQEIVDVSAYVAAVAGR